MVWNGKATGTAMSVPAGLGVGVGASMAVTLMGALAVAWLVNGEMIPVDGIGYGAMLILAAASFLGAWIAAAAVKHRRLLVCGAAGGIYLLFLLGLTAFCFGGQYQGVIPTLVLVTGGSLGAALAGSRGAERGTKTRHKIRTG